MTTIAVIGTGNVGSALGSAAVKAGYGVVFAGQDTAKAREVAAAAGATAAGTPRDAVAGADIVVLAVPYTALADVAAEIAPVAEGKIVIDPSNPIKSDYSGLALSDTSGAEELARLLPNSKVVKAFNTVFAGNAANPGALGYQLDSLFATDDDAAKDAVCGLSSSIGFRPIHVGPLVASRELEAMAWLNIRLQMVSNGNWNTAFALVSPPEAALTYGK
ncbi:MAG TPA: prephenate dehydrogenase/arogenate dehydrogenase family protein [Candidatus Limnocylindrales bacterium]|nr:prephenate dehydrogenase/arogenate dehydrogenase family protein [Candidatus Limnocylindrales bacterium]